MYSFRTPWMLALALGAVFFVVLQTGICALECAGVLVCVEQSDDHGEPSPESENLPSTSHCCHGNCHKSFVVVEAIDVEFSPQPSSRFAILQDAIPDAPVREIDYPPQLS
jgi:hypothetical protein